MWILYNKNNKTKGFTILELIISMALFMIIMIIASETFSRIVTQSSKYTKMEESNIEGVVGLEVMRHDLGQMGYGLPWGFDKWNLDPSPTDLTTSDIAYTEAVSALTKAALLNDSPNRIPRALASFAAIGSFSSDYIALKGTTLGSSKASQCWSYIPFENYSANPRESRPVSFASNNLVTSDKVIFINSNPALERYHNLIVYPGDTAAFSSSFSTNNGINSRYLPINNQHTYMVYGLGTTTPSMPFNRADFFIQKPAGVASTDGSTDGNFPAFCEQTTTGVLYKATLNHADGKYTYIPLLDCVADMQVVLGWNTNGDGAVDTYSSLPKQSDGTVTAGLSATSSPTAAADIKGWLTDAKGLREHLKVIKVYILAQDGKKDRSYDSPVASINIGDLYANNGVRTKADYVLTAEQKHYRWKLYRVVVNLKNL